MYIGFSTAMDFHSDNVSYVYAWSFSNDGILAPPIVMGFKATPASLPAGMIFASILTFAFGISLFITARRPPLQKTQLL